MERLMLLDGNGLIYRGYFALINTPLTTCKGELVNAVFGFCNIVLRGFQDIQPDYVAIAFDLPVRPSGTSSTPSTRPPASGCPTTCATSSRRSAKWSRRSGIPVYELAGFEADDVIGTLTVEAERAGLDTTIVTGDLDMLQLVTDQTRLMTTRMGVQNTVIYDPARIFERYGLRPDQMIDFKALKGDSTDNIPGVPGVGEKTAAKLIGDFGTLDGLYEHIDEVVRRRSCASRSAQARDQVLMGRELMRIVRDLPVKLDLEAARLGDYDRETVIRLFREYEFRTLIERLPPLAASRPSDDRRGDPGAAWPAAQSVARGPGARLGAPRGRRLGIRRSGLQRGSTDWPSGEGSGLQLALDFSIGRRGRPGGRVRSPTDRPRRSLGRSTFGARSATPPRRHRRPTWPCRPGGGDRGSREPARRPSSGDGDRARSRPWLAAQSRGRRRACCATTRGRARARPLALAVAGLDGRTVAVEGPADARPASRGSRAPRAPARRARGQAAPGRPARRRPDRPADAGRLRHPDRRLHPQRLAAQPVDRRRRRRAARPDPAAGRRTCRRLPGPASRPCRRSPPGSPLEPRWSSEGLDRLYRGDRAAAHPRPGPDGGDRRRPRPRRAAGPGRRVRDRDRPARGGDLRSTSATSSTWAAPSSSSRSCSSSSTCPRASGRRPATRPTRRCSRTSAPAHPMIAKLLDWRVYTKLRSTYVDALPTLIAADGRLHTTFHQAVAATGRLSSSDPNLQNIPIRTPLGRRIRRAFVAGAAGRHPPRRRLQPDRAAHPGPRVGRRAPPRRLRARRRHPSRDRRPGPPQGARGRHRATSGRWPRWSTSGSPTG